MNYEKLINKMKKSNGYITTSEIIEAGYTKTMIPQMIADNVIKKVAYGLYLDSDLIEDEYYILSKRYNNIIFSYNTACHLLGLSDRAPYELDITVSFGRNMHDEHNVNIHYVNENILNLGVTEIESPYKNLIKIYNAERCICDLLKNSNEVDIEIYNKVIKNYFKSKNKNLILLEDYAKKINVTEKLNNIMETNY